MSKVKIQGNASGTGVLTVTAPNTSTDRTITLPDATGTLLTTTGSGANLTGVGVDGISSSADATAITINSSEQVGIGQTSPAELLHLKGGTGNNSTAAPIVRIQKHSGGAVDDGQTIGGMSFWVNDDGVDSGAPKERAKIIAESQNTSSGTRLEFWTGNSNAAIAEQMRIQADGAVIVNNGITLGNGLTYAAANTLDEYEEGTFTLAMYSGQSGTITNHFAKYTKIGNTVTLNFRGTINNATGNSFVRISGFPFSLANIHYAATANYSNRQSVQLFMSNGGYFYYQTTTVGGNNQGQDAGWLDASTGIAINVTYIA